MLSDWYKEKPDSVIWRRDDLSAVGEWLFSFDKKKTFNLWVDYPYSLTKEQKEIFDKEFPFWADFFKERTVERK